MKSLRDTEANQGRTVYATLAVVTMGLGLASREVGYHLPAFVAAYAGDTLWATLVYWLTRAFRPALHTWQSAAAALGFAYAIEFSQFYQAPWLNSLRHTTLGALVLGFGFRATDLLCYAAGVACGYALDRLLTIYKR